MTFVVVDFQNCFAFMFEGHSIDILQSCAISLISEMRKILNLCSLWNLI